MKTKILSLFLIMISCSAFAGKLVTINMDTAFLKYYRTIKAEKKLREQLSLIEKTALEMKKEYDSKLKAFDSLIREIKDTSLAKEIRQQKAKEADAHKSDILMTESNLKSFNLKARDMMRKRHDSSRADILEEIQKVVTSYAELNDIGVVLDNSGKTSNRIAAFVIVDEETDITKIILKILNKGHEKEVEDWAAGRANKKLQRK